MVPGKRKQLQGGGFLPPLHALLKIPCFEMLFPVAYLFFHLLFPNQLFARHSQRYSKTANWIIAGIGPLLKPANRLTLMALPFP